MSVVLNRCITWWSNLRNARKAMMPLALLAIIYVVLTFVFLPRHVFFCGDEGEKVIVVASSVRGGDWWRVKFEYPGLAFDPEVEAFFSPWMRVVDGQPVPYHLSTMNFWNAPLYTLLGVSGLYVLPLLAWATFWRVQQAVDSSDARRAVQIAFGLLVAVSLVVQCIGVGILFDKKARMVDWYDDLVALDVEFVLSDYPYYLQEMASLYFERVFLCPTTQEVYERLIARLYEHGVGQFAWVPLETGEIDPLIETSQFAVRQVQGYLHEIVPLAGGRGGEESG